MEGAVTYKLAIVAALLMVAAIGANAARFSDCGISVEDLMSCKSAMAGPVANVPIQGRCCLALKAANLACLCSFSNYMPAFGIDPDRAMQLPVKCGIADSFRC